MTTDQIKIATTPRVWRSMSGVHRLNSEMRTGPKRSIEGNKIELWEPIDSVFTAMGGVTTK